MPGLWRTQGSRVQSVSVEVCWRPGQGESSGDFHDVIDLASGRVAVVLGDAPAFGPAAAELGEELRFDLRRALRSSGDATSALRILDERLARHGPDKIATAVLAVLDENRREAEVVNAGHLPILVASADGNHFLNDRVDPPIGVPSDRVPVRYPLIHDTSLFFFTDGLVERRGASLEDGLSTLLRCTSGLTAGAACASELARRATDRLGQPSDDATIMSVRLRFGSPMGTSPTGVPLGRVLLRLYVDPGDMHSAQAERVVGELVGRLSGRVDIDLEVLDITVSARSAETEGVMAAPTVVRILPEPKLRVVGGLRSASELVRALQLPYFEEPD